LKLIYETLLIESIIKIFSSW